MYTIFYSLYGGVKMRLDIEMMGNVKQEMVMEDEYQER